MSVSITRPPSQQLSRDQHSGGPPVGGFGAFAIRRFRTPKVRRTIQAAVRRRRGILAKYLRVLGAGAQCVNRDLALDAFYADRLRVAAHRSQQVRGAGQAVDLVAQINLVLGRQSLHPRR